MVFAFAGVSTITSFFGIARDTLAMHWDTPRMAPRPSPVYILVAALSWPLLYGLFRLRAPRPRAPAGRRLRARREPQLELRPVAARRSRCSRGATCASWPSRSSSGRRSSSSRPRPARSRCGAASGTRGDRDGDAALPRGPHRGHVPGGDAAEEGDAEEVRGAGAHRGGADRARGGRAARPGGDRRHRPARPARRSCGSPTGRRSRSTTSRELPTAPRRAAQASRPSGCMDRRSLDAARSR